MTLGLCQKCLQIKRWLWPNALLESLDGRAAPPRRPLRPAVGCHRQGLRRRSHRLHFRTVLLHRRISATASSSVYHRTTLKAISCFHFQKPGARCCPELSAIMETCYICLVQIQQLLGTRGNWALETGLLCKSSVWFHRHLYFHTTSHM